MFGRWKPRVVWVGRKVLTDDKRRAPCVGELSLMAVFFSPFVASEGQFLGANVFWPVIRQFFQLGGGLLQDCLSLGLLTGK